MHDTEYPLRAVIFTGGRCETSLLDARDFEADLIIAADSGYLTAKKCGIKPHIIVGDFDSAPLPPSDEAAEILRVPAEKDETDTVLACRLAVNRGARDILIIGGTGGRIDHTLSNIFLLDSLYEQGIRVTLTDGENRVRMMKDTSISLPASHFPYFSLITLGTSRLTLQGCKYSLDSAVLTKANQYAISNEITDTSAQITVCGDAALLIESGAQTL